MNGSKDYKTPGASEPPEGSEIILSLETVQKMLPLVGRIVEDILHNQETIVRLQPETEGLDRHKRELTWPERQRRYRLKDEASQAEQALEGEVEELRELGVVLLDNQQGRVGFPTMVNNRHAYFSWRAGEDGLHTWHFVEEETFRPIPQSWLKEIAFSGKN